MSKVTYETRTETDAGEGPRFIVDQFTGFWAKWEAKRHAKKLVKRGEASAASVFRVTRVGSYFR